MRTLSVILSCFGIMFFAGCDGSHKSGEVKTNIDKVDVILEGIDSFPKELVGNWKADNKDWEIEFYPDGSIVKVKHYFGPNIHRPMEQTVMPLKMDGKSVYDAGRWRVEYQHDSRQLTVEITIDHFEYDLLQIHMNGKMKDIFIGTVSEDWQVWRAEWFTFPDYIVYTEDQPHRIFNTPEKALMTTLIFKKKTPQVNQ